MNLPDNCIDYRGRQIEFPPSTARHISNRHPEVYVYLPRICEVLANPDLVFSRPSENTHIYYKRGIYSDDDGPKYLIVYVRYNGDRSVRTAHATRFFPYRSYLIHQRTDMT